MFASTKLEAVALHIENVMTQGRPFISVKPVLNTGKTAITALQFLLNNGSSHTIYDVGVLMDTTVTTTTFYTLHPGMYVVAYQTVLAATLGRTNATAIVHEFLLYGRDMIPMYETTYIPSGMTWQDFEIASQAAHPTWNFAGTL